MSRYDNPTAHMYQRGLSDTEAKSKGADMELFQSLETEFKGGSIPLHLLRGFKYTPSYSCEFHTGGIQGQQLRNICAELKGQ